MFYFVVLLFVFRLVVKDQEFLFFSFLRCSKLYISLYHLGGRVKERGRLQEGGRAQSQSRAAAPLFRKRCDSRVTWLGGLPDPPETRDRPEGKEHPA